MDEPFGALDPITRAELHREFRALQAQLPRAVLLVTHDLAEAFALAHRVAVLHEGRIVACDAPDALARSRTTRTSARCWRRGSDERARSRFSPRIAPSCWCASASTSCWWPCRR